MVLLGVGSLISMFSGTGPLVGFGATLLKIGTALLGWAPIIGIIIALWITDLGGFREFVNTLFTGIALSIKTLFKDVFGGLGKIFQGFIKIFQGDWEGATELMEQGFNMITKGLIKGVVQAGMMVYNTFAWAWNAVKDLFINLVVKGVLHNVRGLIENLKGIWAALGWDTKGFEKALGFLDILDTTVQTVQDTANMNFISPENMKLVDDTMDTVLNKFLGIEEEKKDYTPGDALVGPLPLETLQETREAKITPESSETSSAPTIDELMKQMDGLDIKVDVKSSPDLVTKLFAKGG